jgi:putative acetyltransferase
MRIRAYKRGDGQPLSEIFLAAVRQTGLCGYSAQQVEVWARDAPEEADFEERAADGRILLVATDDNDRPIAYGDLEADGHIDHLFCHPDMGRKGVASALYDRLEEAAVRMKIPRLYVEASEISRPLFLRKGFIEIARRDFEMEGVPTHNYAMAKNDLRTG